MRGESQGHGIEMLEKLSPLNRKEHGEVTLSATTDFGFAAGEILIPVVFFEMADVAREFPLLFVKGRSLPVALAGIEEGVNAYVGDDGRWLASYVPAKLRAYPFGVGKPRDGGGERAVMLDPQAKELMRSDGDRLFDRDGNATDALKRRIHLLEQMQKAETVTRDMVDALRKSGLLAEQTIRLQRAGARESRIAGLEMVDERALNALPSEEFLALRTKGLLPLIYAHLFSLANLRQGIIAGRYPQVAPKEPGVREDLSKLFREDDEFRFDFNS